jgi:hypothetical protein
MISRGSFLHTEIAKAQRLLARGGINRFQRTPGGIGGWYGQIGPMWHYGAQFVPANATSGTGLYCGRIEFIAEGLF